MRKIKFREWLEEPDYSDIPVQIIYKLEDKNMRILKGYSKDEQKELEYTKNIMSWNDLLHNITYFPANTECGSIKDKYDKANKEEQISIIRDILDFYTDKAEFVEPKKYYVQLIAGDEESYLNIDPNGGAKLYNRLGLNGWKVKFTHKEVVLIDSRFVPFMEEVEDYE